MSWLLGVQGKTIGKKGKGLQLPFQIEAKGKRFMIKATNKLPKHLGGLVTEIRKPDHNKK